MTNKISKTIYIQTTRYLINIAKIIEDILIKNNYNTKIVDAVGVDRSIKSNNEPDYYIFLFIWHIQELPRNAEFYIYNLEQANYYIDFPFLHPPCNDHETRIVTEAFNKAKKIFDYSRENLLRYPNKIRDRCYHLPIALRTNLESLPITNTEKEYDILFFGSLTERRKKIFYFLTTKTPLRIKFVRNKTGLYGKNLYEEIQRARIILNIHAKQVSLIETARIHDCLREGQTIIVSEDSEIDKGTVELYKEIVNFAPCIKEDLSNIYDFLLVVKKFLNINDYQEYYKNIETNILSLNRNINELYTDTFNLT